jgi:hypothetical protein
MEVRLNCQEAFDSYQLSLDYANGLAPRLDDRGLSHRKMGVIPSQAFELLGSHLTGARGKNGQCFGCDLVGCEVKSTCLDGLKVNFRYTYSPWSWEEKIAEECEAMHVFIAYGSAYERMRVWIAPGFILEGMFRSFHKELRAAHDAGRKLPCLRMEYSTITRIAAKVMEVESGVLVAHRDVVVFGDSGLVVGGLVQGCMSIQPSLWSEMGLAAESMSVSSQEVT